MNGIEEIRRIKSIFDRNEVEKATTVYIGKDNAERVNHPLMMRRLCFLRATEGESEDYSIYKNIDSVLIDNGYDGGYPDISGFPLKTVVSHRIFLWEDYSKYDMSGVEEIGLCLSRQFNEILFSFPSAIKLTLAFEENEVTGYCPSIRLDQCTNLRELNLINFKDVEIHGLNRLQTLESVYLDNEQLTDFTLISDNSNLKRISMAAPISTLSGIERFGKLEELVLTRSVSDETCHIPNLDDLKNLHNLKYIEIENDIFLDKSALDSSVETLIDNEDRDKAYIRNMILRAIYLAVAGQKSSDEKPLDELSDYEKKQRTEEKGLTFEDRVVRRLWQFYLNDEYEDINPWTNLPSPYKITMKELFLDSLKNMFPEMCVPDDMKQRYECEKKYSYNNDDLGDGLFYVTKKEMYYIEVDVNIGKGRITGKTNCKYVLMKGVVDTLHDYWNKIIDEPYNDLDINLNIYAKYKRQYDIKGFVFPALYLLYEKIKGYKRNRNVVLVGEFDEDGALQDEVLQGDFVACNDVCADCVIVGEPNLGNVPIPEGLQVFKTRSVKDIKSKLFEN